MQRPSSQEHSNLRLRAHVLMLSVVFVWGATFVLIKNALSDISPLLFNLLRMTLATVCLALIYRSHLRGLTRRAWIGGAVVGACLAMGYQFQTAGLALTTPSKSAFLTGLVVVMVPLLSAIPWLRGPGAHAPGWSARAGAVLAFIGIVLLTSPPSSSGHPFAYDFAAINVGDILSIFCALGFALHVLALARTSPHIPFQQLAVLQIGFATALYGHQHAAAGEVLDPLHPAPCLRHRAGCCPCHRRRLHHPVVGAEVSAGYAYRAHPHHGTGLRVDDLLRPASRTTWPARLRWEPFSSSAESPSPSSFPPAYNQLPTKVFHWKKGKPSRRRMRLLPSM